MIMCFNHPMNIRELGLDQPVLTQYPIRVSKCMLNPYLGNLDNSIMEKKQGQTCFHFLDDLCAKWGVNNELHLEYWCNSGYYRHVGVNWILICFAV